MPDGNNIFIVNFERPTNWDEVEKGNRNVFRLDNHGNVMWQITRIDHPERNWEVAHQQARELGMPGCIEPFLEFRLRRPDGTTNTEGLMPQDVMDWVPGWAVELSALGFGTAWYSLDTETGVAVEITKKGVRPW